MKKKNITPGDALSLFVKNIVVLEDAQTGKESVLPFFADGYPGLMFQSTQNGLQVRPHNKQMPVFFLYGQTIRPIELVPGGAYQLIVFQLYPFVLRSFFNVQPKDLNDDCYDLTQLANMNIKEIIDGLQAENSIEKRIGQISSFLEEAFLQKTDQLDFKIRQSIQIIIERKGLVTIRALAKELKVSDRTFERRFTAEVGITPKQLASIVQFDTSLNQLTSRSYENLTDIVYANGFADQSHFIRVFKAFTGHTPKRFGVLHNN